MLDCWRYFVVAPPWLFVSCPVSATLFSLEHKSVVSGAEWLQVATAGTSGKTKQKPVRGEEYITHLLYMRPTVIVRK